MSNYYNYIKPWLLLCLAVVFAGSLHAQSRWQHSLGPTGSAVENIQCDSAGTLYAATPMEVYRSIDHGRTWKTLPAPPGPAGILAFAVDARNRFVLITDAPTQIVRWDPVTEQWSILFRAPFIIRGDTSSHPMYLELQQITVLPDGDIVAADSHGKLLHYSEKDSTLSLATTAAQTWGSRSLLQPLPNGAILVAHRSMISRSIGNGVTYATVDTSLPVSSFAVAGDIIFAATRGLAASTDNGATWQHRTSGIAAIDTDMIACITAGRRGDLVLLTAAGTMWYSRDRGSIWHPAVAPPIRLVRGWAGLNLAVTAEPDGSFLFGASGNGLMRSVDGSTWAAIETNLNTYALEDIGEDRARGTLIAALDSYSAPEVVLARSTDDGRTWQKSGTLQYSRPRLISASNGQWFALGSDDSLERSVDDGRTWAAMPAPPKPPYWTMAADRAGTAYIIDDSGRVFSSTDAGTGWRSRGRRPLDVRSAPRLLVAPGSGVLVMPDGYRSTDGGDTWDTVADFPKSDYWLVALDDGRLVIANHGIYISADSGLHWQLTTTVRLDPYWNGQLFNVDPFDRRNIISCTLDDTIPHVVPGSDFENRSLYSSTQLFVTGKGTLLMDPYSSGIEYLSGVLGLGPTTDFTERRISLSAFPNPASGIMSLAFDLPQSGVVDIGLDDAYGREVVVLACSERPAGHNVIQYDTSRLPQGLYFLNVTAGTASAHQAVAIVR